MAVALEALRRRHKIERACVLDIDLHFAFSYNDSVIGSTFSNQANPKGVKLDRKPDEDLDIKSDNSYFMVSGPSGTMIGP